jgi:hypothetical protein
MTTQKATGTSTKEKKVEKRERVMFHESRTRLTADVVKDVSRDHVFRWFNDKADRINRAVKGGWDFVTESELDGRVGDKTVTGDNSDLNGRVSKIVGKTDAAAPTRGYLMKLRKEYNKEDKKAKNAIYDQVDEAIRAGQSGGASVAESYGKVNVTNRQH